MTFHYIFAGDKDNNDDLLHSESHYFPFEFMPKLPSSFKSKHILDTQKNCLSETVLLSIQNMFIFAEESEENRFNGEFNFFLDL